MILGTTRRRSPDKITPLLTLNNRVLKYATQYKYLGLTLDPSLSLTGHFQYTIGHVTGRINSLSYLRNYVNYQTALIIYKGTILPLLEYANVVHSLITVKLQKKMQRLQNRALRIIYRHDSDHDIATLHLKANIGTLMQRSNRQVLCLMYRRAHLSNLYPLEIAKNRTRSCGKLKFQLPRPVYERFKSFPLYHGSTLWDNLDEMTQKSQDYEVFKLRIPKKPDLVNFPVNNP